MTRYEQVSHSRNVMRRARRAAAQVSLAALLCLAQARAAPDNVLFRYDAAGNLIEVINTSTDPNNCGQLGNQCGGGSDCCEAGACGRLSEGVCDPAGKVRVTVTPDWQAVLAGGAVQFTATVEQATDPTVSWLVDGVPGGDVTVGTVSTTGLYHAPAEAFGVMTVAVTAVSNAQPEATGSAYVTVSDTADPVTVVLPPVAVAPPNQSVQSTGRAP